MTRGNLNYLIQSRESVPGMAILRGIEMHDGFENFEVRYWKLIHKKLCPVCGKRSGGDWEAKTLYGNDGEKLCFECGLWALEFDSWDEETEIDRSIHFCQMAAMTEGFAPPSDYLLGEYTNMASTREA